MIDLVVDGNSLYARAYYALKHNRELSVSLDSDVADSNPTILTARMLLNILDPYGGTIGKKLDRMLLCWDGAPKKDKKRGPRPADYEELRADTIELLSKMFNAAIAWPPDNEADDAVATYVYRSAPEVEIYVVSGDKDLQQMVNERVHYYDLNKSRVLSRDEILARWHVKRPSQISIALAILGDPSDNVDGVRGWGPKRVEKVFESISPDMNLAEATEVVLSMLPLELHNAFLESMDLTILDPGVLGVPDPKPIEFSGEGELLRRGYSGLLRKFRKTKNVYEGELDVASPDEFKFLQER